MSKRGRTRYDRGEDPRALGSPRAIRRATERGKASRATWGDPRGPMMRIAPTRPKRRRPKKR